MRWDCGPHLGIFWRGSSLFLVFVFLFPSVSVVVFVLVLVLRLFALVSFLVSSLSGCWFPPCSPTPLPSFSRSPSSFPTFNCFRIFLSDSNAVLLLLSYRRSEPVRWMRVDARWSSGAEPVTAPIGRFYPMLLGYSQSVDSEMKILWLSCVASFLRCCFVSFSLVFTTKIH